MSTDRILLLVGVNGVIVSVLAVAYWLLSPALAQSAQGMSGNLLSTFGTMGMKLSPSNAVSSLQRRLDIAGNPGKWTTGRLFATKAMSMIASGALATLVCASKFGLINLRTLVIVPIVALLGFYLPDLLVYNSGTKRQKILQKNLPDTLDLMSVCMKAGLGFDAAISKVATNTTGPLAEEFSRMLQEFRLGNSRSDVLMRLNERTTVMDLRHVVQALIQADKLGIPIANVLAQQSEEMRTKRRQRAEEQAQKVTVKVIFPTLLCILPALMSVIMGPAVINIMHVFKDMA